MGIAFLLEDEKRVREMNKRQSVRWCSHKMSTNCKRCGCSLSDTAWEYCRLCAHVIIKDLRKDRRKLKQQIAELKADIADLTGGRQ